MIQLSNNRIKYKIPHLRLPNSHFIPCWIPIFKRHLVVLQVPRGQEHPKETHWNYVQNGNWKHMKQHKNTCVIIYVMQRYTKYIWSFETLWFYLQTCFFLIYLMICFARCKLCCTFSALKPPATWSKPATGHFTATGCRTTSLSERNAHRIRPNPSHIISLGAF